MAGFADAVKEFEEIMGGVSPEMRGVPIFEVDDALIMQQMGEGLATGYGIVWVKERPFISEIITLECMHGG